MSRVVSGEGGYAPWQVPEVESDTARGQGEAALPTAEDIERIQQQAWDEAHAAGLEQGLAEGRGRIEERVARLDAVLARLARPLEELDDRVEEELVALVIAVSRQLIRRELRTRPDEVVGVVREALGQLPVSARGVRIALHPEDAALVREALDLEGQERPWRLVEDPLLTRGGCRVTTEHSRIDATVETRLARLIARVFGGGRDADGEPDGTAPADPAAQPGQP